MHSYEAVADDHAECSICFEPLCQAPTAVFRDQRQKRICHHFFHLSCAENLYNENHRECPLCRLNYHDVLPVPNIDENSDAWFNVCDKDHDGNLNVREGIFKIYHNYYYYLFFL